MNRLKNYTIAGIIFVISAGTIAHFVYDWSGKNIFLGFFFPVNESVWEHMKLLFFPMLLYSFYMARQLKKDYPCVVSALCFGILLGTFLIPVIFYTYAGVLGKNYTVLDIGTFVLCVFLAFCTVYRLTLSGSAWPFLPWLKLLVAVMVLCFIVFTCQPPSIGLFQDPTLEQGVACDSFARERCIL